MGSLVGCVPCLLLEDGTKTFEFKAEETHSIMLDLPVCPSLLEHVNAERFHEAQVPVRASGHLDLCVREEVGA